MPFTLFPAFALTATYATSPKPGQIVFAVAVLTVWPLCLLPVSAWSCRLALLCFRRLGAQASHHEGPSFDRTRLWAFALTVSAIAALAAATAIPWAVLITQRAPIWFR